MRICLDAGHGTGQNQSPARCGYFEGDRMFTLQRLLQQELEAYGVTVVCTRAARQDDPPLYTRALAAKDCDLFLSLHSNAAGNGVCESVDYPVVFYPVSGKGIGLAEALGQTCTMNIWTGDGFKDIPADRLGPRMRYKESIDEILSEPFDFTKVKPCVESKVFGIGVESYTVGSAEFALSYAAMNRDKCIPLMDNGHYHPTEVVSDKIPALLTFFPEIALHITRPVRWDSDHVVLFDDETKELCKEIVRCGGLDGRVHLALDYFDASVNRIAAWVTGFRNVQKALLNALLTPDMTAEQNAGNFTDLLVRQEELKTMPFGEIWAEYCRRCGVPEDGAWLPLVRAYEKNVLEARA